MKVAEFRALLEEEFERIRVLNKTKGADYRRGEDDAFANFKRTATSLGLTPQQVWAVYANKHWDAILNYCRQGQTESEAIEDRLRDVILYSLLLLGHVLEAADVQDQQEAYETLKEAGLT